MAVNNNKNLTSFARFISRHVNPRWGISKKLIQNMGRSLCPNYFKGVFLSSKIPRMKLYKEETYTIIVLIKGQYGLTGHFVTLHGTPTCIYYIDSLGLPCVDPALRSFLSNIKQKRYVLTSNTRIQHPRSMYCGLYSIMFAVYFDSNKRKIRLNFKQRATLENDKLCIKYLHSMIK